MDDQAGRAGLGVNHWVGYGIKANASALPEGAALAAPAAFTAGKNTLGMPYLRPCPPRGNAPQHNVYTLIATSPEPEGAAARARQGCRARCAQGRQGARRRQPRAALHSLSSGGWPMRGAQRMQISIHAPTEAAYSNCSCRDAVQCGADSAMVQ